MEGGAPLKIMFSAGEASGDLHGARLAEGIHRIAPEAEIFGFGGAQMAASGVRLVADCAEYSVMGVWEVLTNLFRILSLLNLLTDAMKKEKPDLLVLIDYPDFNWRLAKRAKALGIRVFSYIPPSAWAWRKGRAQDCAKLADEFVAIFPFELPVYRAAGANISFVDDGRGGAGVFRRKGRRLSGSFASRQPEAGNLAGVSFNAGRRAAHRAGKAGNGFFPSRGAGHGSIAHGAHGGGGRRSSDFYTREHLRFDGNHEFCVGDVGDRCDGGGVDGAALHRALPLVPGFLFYRKAPRSCEIFQPAEYPAGRDGAAGAFAG